MRHRLKGIRTPHQLLKLGCTFTLATVICQQSIAQVVAPPSQVAHRYETQRNANISDDFSSISSSKWTKRKNKPTAGTAGSDIRSENNQILNENGTVFLSLLTYDGKEAGISALHPHHYGFTVVRWRTRGITPGQKYAAHPAIWSFSWNFGDISRQYNGQGYTSEIDWMEYENTTKHYHSRIIPATNQISDIPASVFMYDDRNDFDGWRIQGYEHTPNEIQVWDYVNGSWVKTGRQVRWTDATNNSAGTIHRNYRSPQYFILSNVWFNKSVYNQSAARLDIDYLHHYKWK